MDSTTYFFVKFDHSSMGLRQTNQWLPLYEWWCRNILDYGRSFNFYFDVLLGLDLVVTMSRYYKLVRTVVRLRMHSDGLASMVLTMVHTFLQNYMDFLFKTYN